MNHRLPRPSAYVLFDNDGVLVDTEPLFFEATRAVLASIGVSLSPGEFEDISLRQGLSLLDLARRVGFRDSEIEGLRALRNQRYSTLLSQGVRVFPGVNTVLETLRQRYGLGIVTSSRREHLELAHRNTNLLQYFHWVIALEDVPATKPDPAPYRIALEKTGLSRERVVVVEDSPRGVESACAAGLACIALPYGSSRYAVHCLGNFSSAARILPDISALPGVLAELLPPQAESPC